MHNKLNKCKKIAEELDLDYNDFALQIEQSIGGAFRCGVVGSSGSGKTTIIRKLLDVSEKLTVNAFSRSIVSTIYASQDNYAVCRDKRLSLDELDELDSDCGDVRIYLQNKFLTEKSLEIAEIQEPENRLTADNFIGMFEHLGVLDCCIIAVDSQMPLSRTDTQFISYLRRMAIPTFVVVTKLDKISDEDRNTVTTYIRDGVTESDSLKLYIPDENQNLDAILCQIRQEIVSSIHVNTSLREQQIVALVKRFEDAAMNAASEKLAFNKDKLDKVAMLAQKKRLKLLACVDEWDGVRRMLDTCSEDLEDEISKTLEQRELDMLDDVRAMLRRTLDVKTYWEVELPNYLERSYRHEIEKVNASIHKGLEITFSKLQRQIKSRINKAVVDIPNFDCRSVNNETSRMQMLDGLSDLRKLQTYSRLAHAGSALVCGTAFGSLGIGGILMAVTAGVGIISDYAIRYSLDKSKKKIEALLPDIIKDVSNRVTLHVGKTVQKEFSKLHTIFIDLRDDWKAMAVKSIDEETATAEQNYKTKIKQIESVISLISTL